MSGQLISPSLPTFLTTCEECGGALTHNPDSLIVCRACGLVHKPIIVDSQLNSALEPDACHRERANRA
jgi:transcription initiation factor TFIIIB Brf1 subunit/transcription initiation factor TFIIB